jgi:hypothetical protein
VKCTWIDIEQQRPPIGVPILGVRVGSTGQPYYCAAKDRKTVIDLISDDAIKISHWMRIPKPPAFDDEDSELIELRGLD